MMRMSMKMKEPKVAATQPKYPLHEKLKAHQHEAAVLGEFLDMLDERGLVLAKWHEHTDNCDNDDGDRACGLRNELYDLGVPSKTELIGFYLEIDPKELSAEKDAMYDELIKGAIAK